MNGEKEITGSVHYLEKVALLPGSTLVVSLLDVTQPSAPVTLASEVYADLDPDFMEYALTFEMAKLQYGHTYSIDARILYDDRVVFASAQQPALDLSEESLWIKDVRVQIVSVSPYA
nr:YbaY family lipoprotein [uncultured Pseudomonas sp.]